MARAKIARYPYAPSEGVGALALLREAAACQALAGDARANAATSARADAWRARMVRDYQSRLVRYRRALGGDRPRDALPDIAFLLDLLARERGAFIAELQNTQLSLESPRNQENEP